MGYDHAAPKRAVTVTVNEDLLRRAQRLTPNLSETVETLLTNFVEQAEANAAQQEQQTAAYIAASDAFVAKYGSLADEFSPL